MKKTMYLVIVSFVMFVNLNIVAKHHLYESAIAALIFLGLRLLILKRDDLIFFCYTSVAAIVFHFLIIKGFFVLFVQADDYGLETIFIVLISYCLAWMAYDHARWFLEDARQSIPSGTEITEFMKKMSHLYSGG